MPEDKEGRKEEKEREREMEKENRGNTRISEVLLPLPPRAMTEQDWAPSTVTSVICKNL
jgi:hypothetical protein